MAKNVLLLSVDQWRGDSLGVLSHPHVKTPHLDAFAADATTFTRHYTCAAPCGPARTTMLTGLYPFNHRSIKNGTPLDSRHSNIALEARKAGYDPVLIGYTDTSLDPRTLPANDPRLTTYESPMPGFRTELCYSENGFAEWLTSLEDHGYAVNRQNLEIYARPGSDSMSQSLPFSQAPARYRQEHSDTAFLTDRIIRFLRGNRQESWFLHAVYLRPHPPWIAPAPYNTLYHAADMPIPPRHPTLESEAAQHPFVAGWFQRQNDPMYLESQINVMHASDADMQAMQAVYFGLISEVDAAIGRLFAYLQETEQWDDTLVVFTSDHGELLGAHWLWGKGGYFDGSNHIPLIVRDPTAPPAARSGRHVDAFTESIDLVPTILRWLGAEVPEECDGRDLAALLATEDASNVPWRDAVFWEFDFREPAAPDHDRTLGLPPDQCTLNVLRDAAFKYVHFSALPPLLFDMKADPNEMINLAADPSYAPIVAEYAQRLLTRRMVHAERRLSNWLLTPSGPVQYRGPRW